MLVPSVAAGAIIGKGGETIAEIQENKHKNMSFYLPNYYRKYHAKFEIDGTILIWLN